VTGRALLWPDSVALVGASDDPAKTTARPLRYLRDSGYAGRIYPVNPRADTVAGLPCWASVRELPELPEHVYVMTGTERAIDAVRECAELGVPVATVLASGFGEDGPVGREREDRLRAAAGSMRVVGPSSLGVINPRNGLLLTANAAFGEPDLGIGRTFVASQSGSVIGALVSRGRASGLSFAGLVSTGGEVNYSLGEICRSTVDDDGIDSYALFLESLRHSDELAAFAAAAAERGKPVVAYKLGRSAQGAALSVSHTGAMAGADDEADAFFRAHRISRVDNLEALIETPPLLAQLPARPASARFSVGVLTTTGGGAGVLVDRLGVRGVPVTRPSAGLLEQIRAVGAPVADNIIMDLTLAGAKHETVSATLDVLQRSGEFDLIAVVIGSSARLHPELAVRAVIERADGPTPLAAFAVPDAPEALAALGIGGVPAFRTPESMAESITAAASHRPPAPRPNRTTPPPPDPTAERRILDELDSYQLLGRLGIPTQPHLAVPVARARTGQLPSGIGFPAAVKALSDQLPHKTDVGAVALGVTREGLAEVAGRIERAVADIGVTLDRLLISEMAPPGVDALVGYRVSDTVGPVIMVAAGGVTAELYRDYSLRLAPVDRDTAVEMISEVRGLAPVVGHRGTRGDLDALADAVVALSRLAESDPTVLEAEINPLRVFGPGDGATALDALVQRLA
jgi:acetate---CoA ligase (ADP-forming)